MKIYFLFCWMMLLGISLDGQIVDRNTAYIRATNEMRGEVIITAHSFLRNYFTEAEKRKIRRSNCSISDIRRFIVIQRICQSLWKEKDRLWDDNKKMIPLLEKYKDACITTLKMSKYDLYNKDKDGGTIKNLRIRLDKIIAKYSIAYPEEAVKVEPTIPDWQKEWNAINELEGDELIEGLINYEKKYPKAIIASKKLKEIESIYFEDCQNNKACLRKYVDLFKAYIDEHGDAGMKDRMKVASDIVNPSPDPTPDPLPPDVVPEEAAWKELEGKGFEEKAGIGRLRAFIEKYPDFGKAKNTLKSLDTHAFSACGQDTFCLLAYMDRFGQQGFHYSKADIEIKKARETRLPSKSTSYRWLIYLILLTVVFLIAFLIIRVKGKKNKDQIEQLLPVKVSTMTEPNPDKDETVAGLFSEEAETSVYLTAVREAEDREEQKAKKAEVVRRAAAEKRYHQQYSEAMEQSDIRLLERLYNHYRKEPDKEGGLREALLRKLVSDSWQDLELLSSIRDGGTVVVQLHGAKIDQQIKQLEAEAAIREEEEEEIRTAFLSELVKSSQSYTELAIRLEEIKQDTDQQALLNAVFPVFLEAFKEDLFLMEQLVDSEALAAYSGQIATLIKVQKHEVRYATFPNPNGYFDRFQLAAGQRPDSVFRILPRANGTALFDLLIPFDQAQKQLRRLSDACQIEGRPGKGYHVKQSGRLSLENSHWTIIQKIHIKFY